MKCPTCGGLIVSEPGICGEPDRRKCTMCGRDPNKPKNDLPSIPSLSRRENKGEVEGDDDMASPEIKRDEEGKVIVPEGYIYQPEHKKKNGTVISGRLRRYGYKKRKIQTKPAPTGRNHKDEYQRRKIKDISERPAKKNPKNPGHPITTATPEEIIKALRKGVAQEIIRAIQEKFS
jgi:hypothetical protein